MKLQLNIWLLLATAAFAQDIDRVKQASEVQGTSVNPRSLRNLLRRQCANYTCPNGVCAPSSSSVCCTTGYCTSDKKCCGNSGCAPLAATCCSSGSYCNSGNYCCTDGGCCPNGYSCTAGFKCSPLGGGGGGSGGGTVVNPTAGGTTTTPKVPSPTPFTNDDDTPTLKYYYYTLTWFYYSYYYTYDIRIEASTVTSTTVSTHTIISAFATNSADAASSFVNKIQTITSDGPYAATRLSGAPSIPSKTASGSKLPTVTPLGGSGNASAGQRTSGGIERGVLVLVAVALAVPLGLAMLL
ncbi:hypothetical protein EJ06DRAFT_532419 [Trichodelitschia bisporula]|uniref:GPI anchored protein n=1 Tax=Trichodelitschia bisporula TaxID=703511 RepID=A0A6G1HQA8_9PEZI|nr:hypothetical protein EJ06DRAFT_532419 [Trichodelitschia bisporula]